MKRSLLLSWSLLAMLPLGTAGSVLGQLEEKFPDGKSAPLVFILDRDGIPIYQDETDTTPSSKQFKMGELFFAKAQSADGSRYHLGKFDELTEDFSQIAGWVEKKHLFIGREPLPVKKAVEMGVLKEEVATQASSAFTSSNALPLRVVSKPEVPTLELAREPGGKGTQTGLKFTWYYVYGIEKTNGKIYYLLGSEPYLYPTAYLPNTQVESAKIRLLGWVDQAALQEWCSNHLLEYNADPDAVRERYVPDEVGEPNETKQLPAKVYQSASEDDKQIVAKEPLKEYWGPEFVTETKSSLARFSPFGLDPQVPRLHVVGRPRADQDWYRVATLGTAGGFAQAEIVRLFEKIEAVNAELRKVDLVFVVDATGSMSDEIDTVRLWLEELSDKYAQLAKNGAPFSVRLRGRDESFSTAMDISISLVAFQDIGVQDTGTSFNTRVYLQRQSLTTNKAQIHAAFQRCCQRGNLGGGTEAMHDGLVRALTESELWRPGSNVVRVMVVISDEPGDAGGATQADVKTAMPIPKGSDSDPESLRNEYTKIYGVYTSGDGFPAFKANLSSLTDPGKRLFEIPDFNANAPRRERLKEILYESIEEAQKTVERRTRDFVVQISRTPDPEESPERKGPSQPAAVRMEKLAIEQAMKRAGVTDIKEFQIATQVSFTEGFVRVQQTEHTHPTYRSRVLLTRNDTEHLRDLSGQISNGLEKALNSSGGFANSSKSPRLIACEALATAIYEVANQQDKISTPERLAAEGLRLRKTLESNSNLSLSNLLDLKESLPLREGGLLRLKADDLLRLTTLQLRNYSLELTRKNRCLRNVVEGETAPEEIVEIDTFKPAPKVWSYRHPHTQLQFYYVPVNYLP